MIAQGIPMSIMMSGCRRKLSGDRNGDGHGGANESRYSQSGKVEVWRTKGKAKGRRFSPFSKELGESIFVKTG